MTCSSQNTESQAGLLILRPLQGHGRPPEKKLGP